jgi:hypothetical protein
MAPLPLSDGGQCRRASVRGLHVKAACSAHWPTPFSKKVALRPKLGTPARCCHQSEPLPGAVRAMSQYWLCVLLGPARASNALAARNSRRPLPLRCPSVAAPPVPVPLPLPLLCHCHGPPSLPGPFPERHLLGRLPRVRLGALASSSRLPHPARSAWCAVPTATPALCICDSRRHPLPSIHRTAACWAVLLQHRAQLPGHLRRGGTWARRKQAGRKTVGSLIRPMTLAATKETVPIALSRLVWRRALFLTAMRDIIQVHARRCRLKDSNVSQKKHSAFFARPPCPGRIQIE